ncbi:uncharacterized protein LOC117317931 [Pecten maximus]|uniref:uncharacterized protein LOC117317931 n=1 Tax=Pecten maximus TaxID=6579 RepID=UPI0014584E57|nr:uncharacterized protein LOC117317931 [Pecten maximus]
MTTITVICVTMTGLAYCVVVVYRHIERVCVGDFICLSRTVIPEDSGGDSIRLSRTVVPDNGGGDSIRLSRTVVLECGDDGGSSSCSDDGFGDGDGNGDGDGSVV